MCTGYYSASPARSKEDKLRGNGTGGGDSTNAHCEDRGRLPISHCAVAIIALLLSLEHLPLYN